MMKGEKLVVGDHVEWTSQAGGHQKVKIGTVLAVVPEGWSPMTIMYDMGIMGMYESALGYGESRGHESYLILGPAREGRRKRQIYFPLVRNLKKIENPTPTQLKLPFPEVPHV